MAVRDNKYQSRRIRLADGNDYQEFEILEPMYVDKETDELVDECYRSPEYYFKKYPGRIIQIIQPDVVRKPTLFVALIEMGDFE